MVCDPARQVAWTWIYVSHMSKYPWILGLGMRGGQDLFPTSHPPLAGKGWLACVQLTPGKFLCPKPSKQRQRLNFPSDCVFSDCPGRYRDTPVEVASLSLRVTLGVSSAIPHPTTALWVLGHLGILTLLKASGHTQPAPCQADLSVLQS